MSQQACTDLSVTNTDNGTSCATCRAVRRNTRRIVVPIKLLLRKGHDLRITCGSTQQLELQEVFKKQITSSCTLVISTMFCVVSLGSEIGRRLETVNSHVNIARF